MENQFFDYRIIVPVVNNYTIYRIEKLHKITIVGEKYCGKSSDMNIKKGLMAMFISKHIKMPELIKTCYYPNLLY